MKVSVIMAVYNNYNNEILIEAIESILNQTYKNIELIICDDCSVDNTYEILDIISKKDSRIKLLRNHINQKAGGARNRCIEVSTGEYIAIMDSDDISNPNRIRKQVDFLNNNMQYGFVGTKGIQFNGFKENVIGEYWFCEKPEKKDFLITLPFVHASLMFRRNVIKEVGGYSEKKNAERSEDYDMLLRMYEKKFRGFNINEELYFIREDDNAIKRRKYKYRFNESYVKFKGFNGLGLMPKGFIYAIKPIVVGLIPNKILYIIKNKYYAYLKKGH